MQTNFVIPAQAGIQLPISTFWSWAPAFAGVTRRGGGTDV